MADSRVVVSSLRRGCPKAASERWISPRRYSRRGLHSRRFSFPARHWARPLQLRRRGHPFGLDCVQEGRTEYGRDWGEGNLERTAFGAPSAHPFLFMCIRCCFMYSQGRVNRRDRSGKRRNLTMPRTPQDRNRRRCASVCGFAHHPQHPQPPLRSLW
jgi:hypothetical protein